METLRLLPEDRDMTAGPSKTEGLGLLRSYYAATPLFLAAEWLWGLNIRVPFFLVNPVLRYSYYGFCCACGIANYVRPRWTPFVALFESSINILLLVAGYAWQIFNIYWIIEQSGEGPPAVTVQGAFSFIMAGAVWFFSFRRSETAVMARLGGRWRR